MMITYMRYFMQFLVITATTIALTESQKVSRCQTASISETRLHIVPNIDVTKCGNIPVIYEDDQPKVLIRSNVTLLKFKLAPLNEFEYFDIRYLLGDSSRMYIILRVYKYQFNSLLSEGSSNLADNLYVDISFEYETRGSFFEVSILEVKLTKLPRTYSHSSNTEGVVQPSVLLSCESTSHPPSLRVTTVEIISKGQSQWLYYNSVRCSRFSSITSHIPETSTTTFPSTTVYEENTFYQETTTMTTNVKYPRNLEISTANYHNANAGLTSETPPTVKNPFFVMASKSEEYFYSRSGIIVTSLLGALVVLLMITCCIILLRYSEFFCIK